MIYFFKRQKLNRLYNRQDKLQKKLKENTNRADQVILEAKINDVERKIVIPNTLFAKVDSLRH